MELPYSDYPNELKFQFDKLLSKLSYPETKDLAVKEIYFLITKNQTPKNLRIWLSSLFDYKRPANNSNNEHEVLIIGFLATIYKTNLIDTNERTPHITKTILKIISLLQNYFKDSNESIPTACSKTWREIYMNCLTDQNLEIRSLLMFETLFGIINGGTDRLSQHTCLIILRDFIDCLGKLQDLEFIRLISSKLFPLFVKKVIDVPTILQIIIVIIAYIDWDDFCPMITEIIEKTLFYLNNSKIPFNHYVFKVESCSLFKLLAIKCFETKEYTIGAYHEKIIKALIESTKDRVIKVQTAAKEAISHWNKAITAFKKEEIAKTSQVFTTISPDALIDIRSAENFYKKPTEVFPPSQNENEFRKMSNTDTNFDTLFRKNSGWVSETKGKNFIKKKTGTGGGFIVLNQEKDRRTYSRNSTENLKNDLNEMLIRSKENNIPFSEDYDNPISNNNNYFTTELDNTVKYDSDNLDDTLDYNEEEEAEKFDKSRFDGILEKEEEISRMWDETLSFIENKELDEAYTHVLNAGDDIYLIRLMMKTGSCLKKLRRKTAVLLLKRLAMIGKSNFLQKMCLNFLDDFKDKNAIEGLKIEEQKKILDTLEIMQKNKGPLQSKSKQLHDVFIKKFK